MLSGPACAYSFRLTGRVIRRCNCSSRPTVFRRAVPHFALGSLRRAVSRFIFGLAPSCGLALWLQLDSLLRRLAFTRAFRVRPFASCAPPCLICLPPCACLRSRFKFLLDTREWLLSPTAARGKCDTLSPLFCLCKARQRTVPFARSRWHGTWPHNRKVGGSPWQLPLPNMYETSCL